RRLEGMEGIGKREAAMSYALDRVSMDEPAWTFLAARLYLLGLYSEAAANRGAVGAGMYGPFHPLLAELQEKGISSPALLERYSLEEIEELGALIDPAKDELFTYIGLFLLADRYLAKDHDGQLFELPQERFLIIAMTLMQEEPK